MRIIFALAVALVASACDPGPLPPNQCVDASKWAAYVKRGPCSAEVRAGAWVIPGKADGRAVSRLGGPLANEDPLSPGECVYRDSCGVDWQVSGCYLADGYMCP